MYKGFAFILLLLPSLCVAKDFGKVATTYGIAEPDLLSVIEQKLQNLDIADYQKRLTDEFNVHVNNPLPVKEVANTTKEKTFYFDPTIVAQQDIKDAQGKVVVAKGQGFNPLVLVKQRVSLLFVDGDNKAQVAWALAQQGKIVLTAGSPVELMKKHKTRIYFDQGGAICKKLGITQVPASVAQENLRLKISQILLKD